MATPLSMTDLFFIHKNGFCCEMNANTIPFIVTDDVQSYNFYF